MTGIYQIAFHVAANDSTSFDTLNAYFDALRTQRPYDRIPGVQTFEEAKVLSGLGEYDSARHIKIVQGQDYDDAAKNLSDVWLQAGSIIVTSSKEMVAAASKHGLRSILATSPDMLSLQLDIAFR